MTKGAIKDFFRQFGLDLNKYNKALNFYEKLYSKYKDHTMVHREIFILNLDLCSQYKSIKGDYVECGVWRGGMSAAIAEVLGRECYFHLFDSFEGLPPAQEADGMEALSWQKNTTAPEYFDNCAADEKFAIEAMEMAKHKDYKLYKGWFDQTLRGMKKPIAILRLDGDWYDSIMCCLDNLYPQVVDGGLIILDDYHTWDGCTKAVHDYLSKIKSPARLHQWHNRVAYIIKRN